MWTDQQYIYNNKWHDTYLRIYLETYLKTLVVGSDVSHAFPALNLKQKRSYRNNGVTFLNWISFQDRPLVTLICLLM